MKHKKLLTGIALAVAAIIVAALVVLMPCLGRAGSDAVVKIPSGATYVQVSDSIAKYLGQGYASKVVRVMKVLNTDLASRHGSYEISRGTSALMAARRLAKGSRQEITITVNGFRSEGELARRIAMKLDVDSAAIMQVLHDPQTIYPYGLTSEQGLSLFLEDSYKFFWNTDARQLVKKIGDNYDKVWDARRRAKASALGLTPAEVMTVCSIVDEETNDANEKGTVGRLYINRLQKGMRLQADPTVRFAVGDFTIRRVKGEHLKVQSPYNTYLHTGLPPGPIRTTSVATIDAVLNSPPNDYLYMCAKEDFSGSHNFAADYATHQANAARYRQALDARGIK